MKDNNLNKFSTVACLIGTASLTLFLQSCANQGSANPASPTGQAHGQHAHKDEIPPTPVYAISLNARSRHFYKSAADDPSYDKLLDDAIEGIDLSRERFADLLSQGLAKVQPDKKIVKVTADEIIYKNPKGDDGRVFTENVWKGCKDFPGQRKHLLRTFLASQKEMDNIRPELSDVVPLIRSSEYLKAAKEASQASKPGENSQIVGFDVAPGLVCVLAADSPNNLRILTEQDLAKMHLAAEDIRKAPLETLLSRLPKDVSVYSGDGKVFMATVGGDFESSLILDDKTMKVMQEHVKGKLVFAVPNKDILFFTGDSEKAGLEKIKAMADSSYNSGARPISKALYSWTPGHIVLYQ